jgi:uncharacterized protein YkwD
MSDTDNINNTKEHFRKYWWRYLLGALVVASVIVCVVSIVRKTKKDEIQTQLPTETLMYREKPKEEVATTSPTLHLTEPSRPLSGTEQPRVRPTVQPTVQPSVQPTVQPSVRPTQPTNLNVPIKTSFDSSQNKKSSIIDGKTYYHKPRSVPMPDYQFNLTDKERFLNAHNYYRSRHCADPVVWDARLEQLAQAWGEELAKTDFRTKGRNIISHPTQGNEGIIFLSTDGKNVNVGQNLAYGGEGLGGGNVQYRKEPEDIVADWYEEMEVGNFQGDGLQFDGSKITFQPSVDQKKKSAVSSVLNHLNNNNLNNSCSKGIRYKFNEPYVCSPATGHFTQVVWKDTNRIGCAAVPVEWEDGSKVWVCNYAPGGNVMSNTEYRQNVIDPGTCGNE